MAAFGGHFASASFRATLCQVKWWNAGRWPRWVLAVFIGLCVLGALWAVAQRRWWLLAIFLVADARAFPKIVRERRERLSR